MYKTTVILSKRMNGDKEKENVKKQKERKANCGTIKMVKKGSGKMRICCLVRQMMNSSAMYIYVNSGKHPQR